MAVSVVDLERQLKAAVRTGKVTIGRKEVANSLKASKLLVWSASANLSEDLLKQCQNLQIPAVRFDGNPIELGRVAGIPYKVSVLAVKSGGDAKLDSFSQSQDYSVRKNTGLLGGAEAPTPTEETKREEEPAEKKTPTTKRRPRKKEGEAKGAEKIEAPKTRVRRPKAEDTGKATEEKKKKTTAAKSNAKTVTKPKAAAMKKEGKPTRKKKAEEESDEDSDKEGQ